MKYRQSRTPEWKLKGDEPNTLVGGKGDRSKAQLAKRTFPEESTTAETDLVIA